MPTVAGKSSFLCHNGHVIMECPAGNRDLGGYSWACGCVCYACEMFLDAITGAYLSHTRMTHR